MIDAEVLAKKLLDAAVPDGVTVMPDIDADAWDEFPLVTFRISVGQAVDNHAPPSAWIATLDINILDDDLDDAKALARGLYGAIWEWADPFAGKNIVEDVGSVNDIEDQSIFTRVATVEVESKWVTQYAGSFSLTLRPSK
ncbi:hypothetical protein [Herbiconiux sp. UC225_62]|uniref:hypothetical protein n=1 Tax=Herbiconiux sp. UC225_62 TaxID=3350168 RepID=UPI0036D2E51C